MEESTPCLTYGRRLREANDRTPLGFMTNEILIPGLKPFAKISCAVGALGSLQLLDKLSGQICTLIGAGIFARATCAGSARQPEQARATKHQAPRAQPDK